MHVSLKNMYMHVVPSEELRNGLGAEDRGSVTIGDAVDVRLDVVIGDDRDKFFEGVGVCTAVEAMSL